MTLDGVGHKTWRVRRKPPIDQASPPFLIWLGEIDEQPEKGQGAALPTHPANLLRFDPPGQAEMDHVQRGVPSSRSHEFSLSALSRSAYLVYDEAGERIVARGLINGEPLSLAPASYRITLQGFKNRTISVEIAAGEDRTLSINEDGLWVSD